MFGVEERERVRTRLLELARIDSRLVSAAAIGASAGGGDRWSDLDLTFGVADGVSVDEVLTDWTGTVVCEFDGAVLFDLPVGSTIYRVFLLPGALQVDLSFTPAAEFGALGPRFHLLFGEAILRSPTSPPAPEHLFGLAVHHLVRARVCIERGRFWQAEYWIHGARDTALSLACSHRGLETSYGRGFDRLPPEVLAPLERALVRALTPAELLRALSSVAAGLLREAGTIPDTATPWLRAELEEFCDRKGCPPLSAESDQ